MSQPAKMLPAPPKYNLFDNPKVNNQCVAIDSGPYSGVVYYYDVVSIGKEDLTGDTVPLSLTYQVVSGIIVDSKAFEDQVTAILFDIIEKIPIASDQLSVKD